MQNENAHCQPMLITSIAVLMGLLIETIRRHRGLTQVDLATAMMISTSSYGRLARGESAVSIIELRKLTEILDFSVTSFLVALEQTEMDAYAKHIQVLNTYGKSRDLTRQFVIDHEIQGDVLMIDGPLLEGLLSTSISQWQQTIKLLP